MFCRFHIDLIEYFAFYLQMMYHLSSQICDMSVPEETSKIQLVINIINQSMKLEMNVFISIEICSSQLLICHGFNQRLSFDLKRDMSEGLHTSYVITFS